MTTARGRLCAQLNSDPGTAARVVDARRILVERLHGTATDPVELQLTDDELAAHVGAVDTTDLDALWPGRPDEWKAFALLSVHLEELIATSTTQVRAVRLKDGRLVANT